ncbi:NXPE family member 3-like [Branchiostoma lanceolatum]|uniref:NXPE family member 3-like n=1 Tax=Branchiostoma lanceolatum TaxID=7740 RepID=UPI0034530012
MTITKKICLASCLAILSFYLSQTVNRTFDKGAPPMKYRHNLNGEPRNNQARFDRKRLTCANNTLVSIANLSRSYYVGDNLSISVIARDGWNRYKTVGEDFFIAKLYGTYPTNASTAGRVMDYGNGTYSIRFLLSWSGTLSLSVTLIHPSEAVQVLKRIHDTYAERRVMSCDFIDTEKSFSERTKCRHKHIKPYFRNTCNFSKPSVNGTWYCMQPKRASCDSISKCQRDEAATEKLQNAMLTPEERRLFTRSLLYREIPNSIKITVHGTGIKSETPDRSLSPCGPNLKETESEGYWYNGTWQSSRCFIRRLNLSKVYKCLENKSIFFQGDSTLGQWYFFLKSLVHGIDIPLKDKTSEGPIKAANYKKNITVHFRFHHLPINRPYPFEANRLHYVADEIDKIDGGKNIVIVLGLWAHFAAESIDIFRSRLYGIRHAIIRLHRRSPDTKVIWRTSNTREHSTIGHYLENSDWFAFKLLEVTKLILGDLKIAILDVWDMSVCQWHKHLCHPPKDVIKNHIDLLLSYIC